MKAVLHIVAPLLCVATLSSCRAKDVSTTTGATDPLGLQLPLEQVEAGVCADGGSIKGFFVDSQNRTYHFFFTHERYQEGPLRWYVQYDYNSGKALLLPRGDAREDAVVGHLRNWYEKEMPKGLDDPTTGFVALCKHWYPGLVSEKVTCAEEVWDAYLGGHAELGNMTPNQIEQADRLTRRYATLCVIHDRFLPGSERNTN